MAWMETDYSKHTYFSSMEGKMAAGAFGRARNYGWDFPFLSQIRFSTRTSITPVIVLLGLQIRPSFEQFEKEITFFTG